ncbi:MAG: TonB-dependent receptor domain-containing protein [Flavobacterium sp.]
MKSYLIILSLFFCSLSFAQSTITGVVSDSKKQPIPGVNVKIEGASNSTSTDADGKFTLTAEKLPCNVEISGVGYEKQKLSVTSASQAIAVSLKDEETQLNEIVVSASRTPERIRESPVTIERMTLRDIKNTTSPTFYEGLENLKEVHFNTSSFNFKSINTRGFATVANTRFMQLVDGMDNSSPALNFNLGNLIGLSDLDVHNVELLPGASSALYGANAFNGILFMNSKNPFEFQGISTYVKRGITNQDVAGTNEFLDFGFRAAHAFSKHFAAKANFTYMRATEWIPADDRDVNGGLVGHTNNRNYDGLNFFGDEASSFIPNVGTISRDGYREQDLNDNEINNIKFDASLHFRPWATSSNEYWKDTEIIAQHKVGLGNTVYQGGSRYALRNFFMNQTRAEIKHKNFFIRGYLSAEDAGDSYDMRFAALNINRRAKSDIGWFTDYATAFIQSQIGLGFNGSQADAFARDFATNNINNTPLPLTPNGLPQFQPGTTDFANALSDVRLSADVTNGALFKDQSRIWHSDWNYNLRDHISFADIQIGGSFRTYVLDSQGTIFTDFDGPIKYNENGLYTQFQKKFLEDRLKFTGSIRYDKSELFDGQFSPRVSFVYTAGERKNHNFRASFQTGFRNPTTQDLFIGLNVGPRALVGSAASNLTRFSETIEVSSVGQLDGNPDSVTLNGVNAYGLSYTSESVQEFLQTQDTNDLVIVQQTPLVKPEQVKAFELGYKSSIKGFNIDVNGYYNLYNDFMSSARIVVPFYGLAGKDLSNIDNVNAIDAISRGDRRTYDLYTNTSAEVSSYGAGLGLSKKVYKDFELTASYNWAAFDYDETVDPAFRPMFNTPEHRAKLGVNNDNLFKNFGFGINGRWWSEYEWTSTFADGMIPSTFVLDAQMSYAIPSLKSVIKLTGSNIGSNDYLQVIGAGRIGQIYTLGISINP